MAKIDQLVAMLAIGYYIMLAQYFLGKIFNRAIQDDLQAGQLRGGLLPTGFFPAAWGHCLTGDDVHAVTITPAGKAT